MNCSSNCQLKSKQVVIFWLVLQLLINTNNSSARMLLNRPGMDSDEGVAAAHRQHIQEYQQFNPWDLPWKNAHKWIPGVNPKWVRDMKQATPAKWVTPPPNKPITIPPEYERKQNHYGFYKPTNLNVAYKALEIRDGELSYDSSLGLIPDTVRMDSRSTDSWFTPWYFARVGLSQKDAIKARYNALGKDMKYGYSLVVKTDLKGYNKWISKSDWPELQIYQISRGYHIAATKGKGYQGANWQIPPYFVEVRQVPNPIIKLIVETIDPMQTFQSYADNYNKNVDTICANYEGLEYRWCMTQGDFIGGLVF